MNVTADQEEARRHRGAELRREAEMPDKYGLLFLLVLVAVASFAIAGQTWWAHLLPVLVQGGMLLFAQSTSRASRRLLISTFLFIVAALAVGIAAFAASSDIATKILVVIGAVIVASTITVIGRRVVTHQVVSGATVLGALSIYLLVGLLFSYAFEAIALFSGEPFFRDHPNTTAWDFLYFSYVTMTTVGYGDLVAASSVGQLAAVCQALLGQIYLVTVVALAVSKVGAQRLPRNWA